MRRRNAAGRSNFFEDFPEYLLNGLAEWRDRGIGLRWILSRICYQ